MSRSFLVQADPSLRFCQRSHRNRIHGTISEYEHWSAQKNLRILEKEAFHISTFCLFHIHFFVPIQSFPLTCIVQAVSRDILCYAMRTLSHCFIVGHVHDELIIECSPALNSMWSVNRWEDPRTGCRISFFGLMVMIRFFTRKTTDTKKMIPASNTGFSFYNQPGTASLLPLAFSFSEGITSSFSFLPQYSPKNFLQACSHSSTT